MIVKVLDFAGFDEFGNMIQTEKHIVCDHIDFITKKDFIDLDLEDCCLHIVKNGLLVEEVSIRQVVSVIQ